MQVSDRKSNFRFRFYVYWLNWQTKRSTLAEKDIQTAELHQHTWNHYHMLGFVSADVPWNAISNIKLWEWYNALQMKLVLPSVNTLSNIGWREYTLTVDAIKKQLPLRNKVGLALDGWTSTNKLAITSMIAYYLQENSALREVPLAFDEGNSPFFSHLYSSLSIRGEASVYGSKASRIFEGGSWPLRVSYSRSHGITTTNTSSNY